MNDVLIETISIIQDILLYCILHQAVYHKNDIVKLIQ